MAMFNYDETQTLAAIDVPVLIIVGASDIATIPAASRYMQSELRHSELITLKPGGHMSLMEQNRRFAEAASAFSGICSNSC